MPFGVKHENNPKRMGENTQGHTSSSTTMGKKGDQATQKDVQERGGTNIP